MKQILLILSFLFLSTQELVKYSNKDYSFEIKIPKTYTINNERYEERFASIEIIKISGSRELSYGILKGNLLYRVICYKYTSKPIIKENKFDFHDVIINYTKHMNEESFKSNNLKIERENQSSDTLNYILSDDTKGIVDYRRIVFRDSSSYCMSIMSNKKLLKSEYINEFFNSLKIK